MVKHDEATKVPVCVDLDGTLLRTDTLIEAFILLIKRNAFDLLRVPVWLLQGKAHLKSQIAQRVTLDPSGLPYRQCVLGYLQKMINDGHDVVLATGSNERFAESIARHLGIFSHVLASDEEINLTGNAKAHALCARFGERGFDYIGNDKEDLAVWCQCRKAVAVNPNSRLERRMGSFHSEILVDEQRNRLFEIVRSLRPHHWLKNILVVVPLLTSHSIGNVESVGKVLLAFIAFCLCSSSAYVLNDLLDLPADRAHPTKRTRPFASGSLLPVVGLALVPILSAVGLILAYELLPPLFIWVLGGYYAATIAYSLWLKRVVVVDVIVLAILYTTRIIGGAAAISLKPSFWLLAFAMFLFLSLAMVKRYAELNALKDISSSRAAGRGYRVGDLVTLSNLGGSASYPNE